LANTLRAVGDFAPRASTTRRLAALCRGAELSCRLDLVGRKRHRVAHILRDRAPAPTRAMGNWFSLAALGLFSIIVSPFALAGAWIFASGTVGALLLISGIRGVVRTYRRTATGPSDPYDIVREWAAGRREAFFDRELSLLGDAAGDKEREQFVASTYAAWWDGSSSTSAN